MIKNIIESLPEMVEEEKNEEEEVTYYLIFKFCRLNTSDRLGSLS
jgi:hypothetical protein